MGSGTALRTHSSLDSLPASAAGALIVTILSRPRSEAVTPTNGQPKANGYQVSWPHVCDSTEAKPNHAY